MTALSDAPARDAALPGASVLSRFVRVAVAVVLAIGFVAYFVTRSDMWLDEALTVNIARLPLGELREALRHDGAPPLYYVLLHVWTGVFGSGDLAARSLSGVTMLGAVVALWFAARRMGGRSAAWIVVLIMASNPYVIRYATEARMYALELLLVAVGILVFHRALEQPSLGRLAAFGAVVALLLYTQYWTIYLLLVTGLVLLLLAWRGPHQVAARRMLAAMAVGGLAFVPWLSTFLYQRAHTGTPWGTPVLPGIPIGETVRDFAGGEEQEGWLLFIPMFMLLLLGLFGRGEDTRHVQMDVRGHPAVRWEALVGGATLVVALFLNYAAGSAFQTRYSVLVFPFYVLIVARGGTTLLDPRVRAGLLAVVVLLGFVGAGRNAVTQRTQAGQVARVLRAEARAGDEVVYCPDQVGPSVHRLAPKGRGLSEVTYPAFGDPSTVDWVDYKARLRRADPAAFAQEALHRAGNHTIWFVSAPGYTTHVGTCETISSEFAKSRPLVPRVNPDDDLFELPGLQQFPSDPVT